MLGSAGSSCTKAPLTYYRVTRRTMFPINTFVSERREANLLEQVRWRDGGSRRIEAFPKTDSHHNHISERFSSIMKCSANRGKKRSKPFSKLRHDSPTICSIENGCRRGDLLILMFFAQ